VIGKEKRIKCAYFQAIPYREIAQSNTIRFDNPGIPIKNREAGETTLILK